MKFSKALFILCLVLSVVVFQAPAWAFVPHVGDRAQDLSSRDILTGSVVHLEDSLGSWTYLEFWSVNCGPCVRGLAGFVTASRQYTGRGGLRVLFATEDTARDARKLRRTLIRNGVYFPVLYFGDKGPEVCRSWNVGGGPAAYLIDPQGDIVAKTVGASNCLTLLRAYAWTIEQVPAPPRAGLRCSLGAESTDGFDLRLELSSPQHAPLRLELDYVLLKLHFGPDGQLVSVDHIDPVKDGPEQVLRCEFREWGESVQNIHIDLKGCEGAQFKVRMLMPGSDDQEQGAGFWSEQRGCFLIDQGDRTFCEYF